MDPPDPQWVAQTLIPYLRYAFNYALPYDADIESSVTDAISVCMQQPYHPGDCDDLLFECICMAIEFRYRSTVPELKCLTEDLDNLARFLIRRAQVKGPYELLGRMNIGSGAWQEHEKGRLEKLKQAAEKEKFDNKHPFRATPKPEQALPTEDQTDPRLVNALPGQFVHEEMVGPLTIAEDQAYRHQNRVLKQSREAWMRKMQQAAMTRLPERMVQWVYQQPVPLIRAQAPVYVQDLRMRKRAPQQCGPRTQGPIRHAPIHTGPATGFRQHPYAPPQQHAPRTQVITHRAPIQNGPATGHRQPPQQQIPSPPRTRGLAHHAPIRTGLARTTYPVAPTSSNRALPNTPPAPIADTSYLRPESWTPEAVEQRARDWPLLTKQQKARQLLRMLEGEHHATHTRRVERSSRAGASVVQQQQRLQPAGAGSQATASRVQQQQPPRPLRVTGTNLHSQPGSQEHVTSVVMHPGFSNVTSVFPNVMQNGYGTGNTRRG